MSPKRCPHPRSAQSESQAKAQATGTASGQLRIMCLPGPSICHLALWAQDKIHCLLRETMICSSHVSFPVFFFFNQKLLFQSPGPGKGKSPGHQSWPQLPIHSCHHPSSFPALSRFPLNPARRLPHLLMPCLRRGGGHTGECGRDPPASAHTVLAPASLHRNPNYGGPAMTKQVPGKAFPSGSGATSAMLLPRPQYWGQADERTGAGASRGHPALLPFTASSACLSVCLSTDVNPRSQKFIDLLGRAHALRTEVRQCGLHPCVLRHKPAQVPTHRHLQCTLMNTDRHTHTHTLTYARVPTHLSMAQSWSTALTSMARIPEPTNRSPQLSNCGLPQF